MARFKCVVCEYIYDEDENGQSWESLPEEWVCPVCESPKKYYSPVGEGDGKGDPKTTPADEGPEKEAPIDLQKTMSEAEPHFADIQDMAKNVRTVLEPMRTKQFVLSWDEILIKGAQLAKIPLNPGDPVRTETVIGPKAKQPLVLDTPLYVTHMSFGALSSEAKVSLAKGSAAVGTAVCSGEGGILPEEFEHAHKYIFEYVPNQYSVTDENIQRADAIEIKIGQSAKPGMGGHLPGGKVTPEIAAIRGAKPGEDIKSPSHFRDILTKEDLKDRVAELRALSNGRPIGVKLAAGHIEADLTAALYAEPDFITLDGRAGATGSAPKFVKAATSIPTIFALYRARKFFKEHGIDHISLVITGGLRVSSDFAKALALGADAVALGTSALIAIGCQQYRVCHTGKCPMGITTQDPLLRSRLNVDQAAQQLQNFLQVSTEELKDFARLTGNHDVHDLSVFDLCTTRSEISNYTDVKHV